MSDKRSEFTHLFPRFVDCYATMTGGEHHLRAYKDWERWSRMTKQELMADESGEVCRIEHRGKDWFEKVKRELGRV